MSPTTDSLPVSETIKPTSLDEVTAQLRACCGDDVAVYPVGGGTSLDFGLPARKPGIALSLRGLQRVVEYPARDMTVTVEAGMTLQSLAELLAAERQQLPLDVPQASAATVGGMIATNFNGPRRYGYGTIRDYVIGIHAVDGTGRPFKGGGRVVKNVAGYDFCKLLTGSLGTLGVITQVTFKLKPLCERRAVVICGLDGLRQAESVLAGLVHSRTTPTAIELLQGPAWSEDPALRGNDAAAPALSPRGLYLAVAVEGTDPEVRWMVEQLGREFWEHRIAEMQTLLDDDATAFLQRIVAFPVGPAGTIRVKASVVPSRVTDWCQSLLALDPDCSWLAHAGNGIVVARFARLPAGGMTKGIIGRLQSAATAASGSVVMLSHVGGEATHQSIWGPLTGPLAVMKAVKCEFDPRNILNPDRFVY
ncbi:MAG: FAD-binding oxidoreductase [Pirellulaceae bacterium]